MTEKEKENQIKKRKRGNSLIEALVALGILLVGIVPVVTVATQAILFHHRATEAEEAARISQTMIDYIKSRGYDKLNVLDGTKYSLSLTSGGAFTVDGFGGKEEGNGDFFISQDLILLNSKGINLNDVNFYVVMKRVKGELKKIKLNTDPKEYETYNNTDPVTNTTSSSVYTDDLIYGQFIFGYGAEDLDKKTDRETELKTTFIITPIENWK